MCRLPCSVSASLRGSPWKSARAFCRRISTTQSPMSRARKRYRSFHRSDDVANRTRSCLRTAQRWLDQMDLRRCSQAHFPLQSIENYLNRLSREQADQSSPPSEVQLAVGLRSTGKHGFKVNQSTEGRPACSLIDGEPVLELNFWAWAYWVETHEDACRIAYEEIGDFEVSTVFLVLNRSFDSCAGQHLSSRFAGSLGNCRR